MKIEEIKDLLEEIGLDEDGYGYIDCNTATDYTDNYRYERIVAALKQNIALQQTNAELTKKIEEVEEQAMESSVRIEKISKTQEEQANILNNLLYGISECLLDVYDGKENELRIGDYIFKVKKDHIDFNYEPINKHEPIEVKIKITENSGKSNICPICNKEIGKYPAISRKDNETEICSNCGMLEALEDFYKANKDDEVNEQEI